MAVRPCHRCIHGHGGRRWAWDKQRASAQQEGLAQRAGRAAGGSGLLSATHTATEAPHPRPRLLPVVGGAGAVGRDSGGWCQQTGIPGGESPVKSVLIVLAPGFFGSKSCCSHLQDRSLGTVLSSSVDLTLEHLQPSLRVTSQLHWSLAGVTEVGPSSSTPEAKEQGSWSLRPLFLSLWGELFPARESPLVPRTWPWGTGWWRQKRNVLPSLFVGLFSSCFIQLSWWSCSDSRALPALFLFVDSSLLDWFLWRGGGWGSPTLPS